MRNSKSISLSDFSGGLNTKDSYTDIKVSETYDLDNIILMPRSGFQKRNGNSKLNATAMASGASVHGIGYYRQKDLDEWLLAIAGTKIYSTAALSGTMTDITGSVTITAGNDNIWTYSQMNDIAIFVGGARATDVPVKWTGSGNAAALGGTPPVGAFGIVANNRLFIGNTIANPSRMQWCILGNPEDWSGAGSGSTDISTNDGDGLVGASLIGVDHLLVFKQNSIHELIVRTSPFPTYPLFRNVGAISNKSIVNVDGVVYFITPEPRMKATDGTQIVDFDDRIDSVWDSLNKSRLQYIHGVYDKRRKLILWFCSSSVSSTHDICIAWDLDRKCWLQFTTGHKMNDSAIAQDRLIYGGAYDGHVYRIDDPDEENDASESGNPINGYWRSGWISIGDMTTTNHVPYVDLNFVTQDTGDFRFSYGYDFNTDAKEYVVDMRSVGPLYDNRYFYDDGNIYGGTTDKTKLLWLKGNGKFFQFKIFHNNSDQRFKFNRLEMPAKELSASASK